VGYGALLLAAALALPRVLSSREGVRLATVLRNCSISAIIFDCGVPSSRAACVNSEYHWTNTCKPDKDNPPILHLTFCLGMKSDITITIYYEKEPIGQPIPIQHPIACITIDLPVSVPDDLPQPPTPINIGR
jgi:hypothetical protein